MNWLESLEMQILRLRKLRYTVSSPFTAPSNSLILSLSTKLEMAPPIPFIVFTTTRFIATLTEMTASLKIETYLFEMTCSSEPTKQYGCSYFK